MEVYVISVGKGIYTAMDWYFGVPVSTSLLYRKETKKKTIEKDIMCRFRSQVAVWKTYGLRHEKLDGRVAWSFKYIDFDQFIKMYPQAVVNMPFDNTGKKEVSSSNGLKKLYEITQGENGEYIVKKHDEELLDENQVKLILFQKVVNQ